MTLKAHKGRCSRCGHDHTPNTTPPAAASVPLVALSDEVVRHQLVQRVGNGGLLKPGSHTYDLWFAAVRFAEHAHGIRHEPAVRALALPQAAEPAPSDEQHLTALVNCWIQLADEHEGAGPHGNGVAGRARAGQGEAKLSEAEAFSQWARTEGCSTEENMQYVWATSEARAEWLATSQVAAAQPAEPLRQIERDLWESHVSVNKRMTLDQQKALWIRLRDCVTTHNIGAAPAAGEGETR